MLNLPDYPALAAHAKDARQFKLHRLFDADQCRAKNYCIDYCNDGTGLYLDYAKNLINAQTLALFSRLSAQARLQEKITALMQGEALNNSEQKPALHTLLRAPLVCATSSLRSKSNAVQSALNRVKSISEAVRSGRWKGCTNRNIRHLVHLGIGGSYLGPHMLDEALAPYRKDDITCHYVANIDGAHIHQVLQDLDATETLIIIVSKSFTTLETMTNAATAKAWLLDNMPHADLNKHLAAITTNVSAARCFGIAEENLIPIWDWVGGRYSLWSGVSLPIAIRYGYDVLQQLLQGAHALDKHAAKEDLLNNMPMLMAWISVFYQQFFGATSHAVLAYDHGLRLLPAHLQQVDMESNGKSVTLAGDAINHPTGAILWGGEGSNGQHAFHQLLHQGNRFVGIDFILPLKAQHNLQTHHNQLAANCFSQAQALMFGRTRAQITDADNALQRRHKVMPGNRPSNMLLLDQVSPKTLGALVALYEHKVFFQAVIWQINPFDQWGVELGKQLAGNILESIQNNTNSLDGSTDRLVNRYRQANAK